jgi:hypothetical protein
VYPAEDTRLRRKVAMKILPTELATRKDRMRRFEQEAQAVSLQNQIARNVTSKLRIQLTSADPLKLAKNYTNDPEAYRLYLQGRFFGTSARSVKSKKRLFTSNKPSRETLTCPRLCRAGWL